MYGNLFDLPLYKDFESLDLDYTSNPFLDPSNITADTMIRLSKLCIAHPELVESKKAMIL